MGGGSLEEARQLFGQLMKYRNDLGLYGEEIDANTGLALGKLSSGLHPRGFNRCSAIHRPARKGGTATGASSAHSNQTHFFGGEVVNWTSWLLSGFLATLALSTLLSASQGFGFTRMNLPYLIGTFVTPQRERAKVYGFLIHLVNGWLFSILYVLVFEARHMANWWFGALLGLAHALYDFDGRDVVDAGASIREWPVNSTASTQTGNSNHLASWR